MSDYFVEWSISVRAETPEEAAQAALTIQRDPLSLATVFDVIDEAGETHRVDLYEDTPVAETVAPDPVPEPADEDQLAEMRRLKPLMDKTAATAIVCGAHRVEVELSGYAKMHDVDSVHLYARDDVLLGEKIKNAETSITMTQRAYHPKRGHYDVEVSRDVGDMVVEIAQAIAAMQYEDWYRELGGSIVVNWEFGTGYVRVEYNETVEDNEHHESELTFGNLG